MKKVFLLLTLAGLLAACDKNEGGAAAGGGEESIEQTLGVSVDNTSGADRIEVYAPEAEAFTRAATAGYGYVQLTVPQGYAASSVAFVGEGLLAVSYRPVQKSTNSGIVEVISLDERGLPEQVVSRMQVEGRINHLATDGVSRLFFGLDAAKGPALAVVPLVDGRFPALTSLTAYTVNGVSLNSVCYSAATGALYSATGGSGTVDEDNTDYVLGFDGKKFVPQKSLLSRPGYQKFTPGAAAQLTPVCYQGNSNNRGKWVDAKDGKLIVMHYSGNYNAYCHNSIQLYASEADVDAKSAFNRRQIDQKLTGWFNNSTFIEDRAMCRFGRYDDLIYVTCGHKGLHSYSIDSEAKKLVEVGEYLPVSGGSENTAVLAFDFIDAATMAVAKGNLGVDIVTVEQGRFTKAGKTFRYSDELDDSYSANYVASRNGVVYVSYGRAGLIVFAR